MFKQIIPAKVGPVIKRERIVQLYPGRLDIPSPSQIKAFIQKLMQAALTSTSGLNAAHGGSSRRSVEPQFSDAIKNILFSIVEINLWLVVVALKSKFEGESGQLSNDFPLDSQIEQLAGAVREEMRPVEHMND